MRKVVIIESKTGVVSIVPENCRTAIDVIGLLRYALLIEEQQCIDAYVREARASKHGVVTTHFVNAAEARDGEATTNG